MHGKDFSSEIVEFYRATVDERLRGNPFDASSRDRFLSWQKDARDTLKCVLGDMPRKPADTSLVRRPAHTTDAYVCERVVYETTPGLHATALLLTPKRVPLPAPAVLCLHGHGGSKDQCLDPECIYTGFAARFAEAGCVVLCPDQIPFGERLMPSGDVTYDVIIHGLNMVGMTLVGLRYGELVRALDLLEGLDEVRGDRIGVVGLSLGGEMTLFLAGLQPRVGAACISGYLTSHRTTFLSEYHCTCGHLRDLARHFEHVDLAALIAPRPLFVEAGRRDPQFPSHEAEATVRV